MFDLKFIRENRLLVVEAVRKKREKADIDKIITLDEQRRQILGEVELLKAERNSRSQDIGKARAAGEDAAEAIAAMKSVGDRIKELDTLLAEVMASIDEELQWVPNLPDESVPEGDESANVLVREWGEKREEAGLLDHIELGEKLGLLSIETAAHLSGHGFVTLTGDGARLQRALINFMMDMQGAAGYREMRIPYASRPEGLFGCGQLPKLKEDMYEIPLDGLYLIPTAEVPLTNFYRGAKLTAKDLPIKLAAYSACFRREAGAHGKDTRGLIRLHQFDKVELVKLVTPESSYEELEGLTGDAEAVLKALGLPYRVLTLATGDLSFASAKTYDIELWAPGEKRWLEVSSCSNFLDFQARRIGLRYRGEGGKLRFVHTLNGSGVALPRLMVAIMEHYQTENGWIKVPNPLRPYLDNKEYLGQSS
jgi:seryl-tRNA synthetase